MIHEPAKPFTVNQNLIFQEGGFRNRRQTSEESTGIRMSGWVAHTRHYQNNGQLTLSVSLVDPAQIQPWSGAELY